MICRLAAQVTIEYDAIKATFPPAVQQPSSSSSDGPPVSFAPFINPYSLPSGGMPFYPPMMTQPQGFLQAAGAGRGESYGWPPPPMAMPPPPMMPPAAAGYMPYHGGMMGYPLPYHPFHPSFQGFGFPFQQQEPAVAAAAPPVTAGDHHQACSKKHGRGTAHTLKTLKLLSRRSLAAR